MDRDVEPGSAGRRPRARSGRSVIAVIGIDRYTDWPRLANAVSDAQAVARLFAGLGLEQVTAPLLDEAATGDAMRRLVTDDLAQLSPDDSLVLFFAGHGHTHKADFGDTSVKTGCLIPVDGASPRGHVSASWLRLDAWLSDIARLPPRHILVFVDACHSGVALGALNKWRDGGPEPATELAALQARRSRRVITSALDDQRAMDGGPYPGHSLFTGCLLEAFSGGLAEGGRRVTTGRELGLYLQRRVRSYPPSTQTPDFGTFELDDRGDLVVPALVDASVVDPPAAPRVTEPADTTKLTLGTGETAAGARWRTRVAVGVATGALIAVLALVVMRRGAGEPPAASGGSEQARIEAGAPAGSAATSDVRIPDAVDAAPPATALDPTVATVPADAAPTDATLARVPGPPAHPLATPPVATSPHDRRGASGRTTARPAVPRTTTTPDAQPPADAVDASASPPSKCSKAAFAAVYEAPSPALEAVRVALRDLKACRDVGAINEAQFDRYQTALVNRM